jgi:RimJ/RimL family protein N-acetyltransferase
MIAESGMRVEPVTLEGRWVRLEPLAAAHAEALADVGLEPRLWQWIPTQVHSRADMHRYVQAALEEQRRGVSLPFAIVERGNGRPIGSTRYGNIEPAHRRLEIGWTWLALPHQRTAANTEAKLLLLGHAFERLGANRVELKTDALNEQSRRAILRLGAVQEGIFRKHIVCASGRVRDTVYFSILDTEWPSVRARLQARLDR